MIGEVAYTHTGNDYDTGRLTVAIISREKSQIGGDIFFQLYSTNAICMVDFIEISGNRCANTKIHLRRLKHPTQVFFLNDTYCQFVDYKY